MDKWLRTGITRLLLGVVLVIVGILASGHVAEALLLAGAIGIAWGLLGVVVGLNRAG